MRRPDFTLPLIGWFLGVAVSGVTGAESPRSGFQTVEGIEEQERWTRLESGVRVYVNAPSKLQHSDRLLVVYATPNGNTIEQTLGCAAGMGLDWRFDIQHVAAQIRQLRQLDADQEIVLAVIQASQLSWPTFRRDRPNADTEINQLVASLAQELGASRVALTGHSGGGSFLFGFLNAADEIPAVVDRIVFLDANYSYSDQDRHGEKLLTWLRGHAGRHLIVIAYDDREITFNGKKVVGPTGGTFRASERMLTFFGQAIELTEREVGPFRHVEGLAGQLQFEIHPNRENKILHTALVGEMNGLLHGLTAGTSFANQWGTWGGPRSYGKWISLRPFVDPTARRAWLAEQPRTVSLKLPPRRADAPTGQQFRDQILTLPRDQRERAVLREITQGNVPDFLRNLVPIQIRPANAALDSPAVVCHVMSDYLAIGTDQDFFRMPMTPGTAWAIAAATETSLITRKISDDIFAAASQKLEPHPLTKNRDSVEAFYEHHQFIEQQLAGQPRDVLVAGIKKDVVLSHRLLEKPHKVAIYGWHYPNGSPIQPLYVGHVDWYVDYSHGIRLMADHLEIGGQRIAVTEVLRDPERQSLLSDEGPLDVAEIVKFAQW